VRPCYLADLTATAAGSALEITFSGMSKINGREFSSHSADGAIIDVPVGSQLEIRATGIGAGLMMGIGHVLHVHVNPFQLVAEPVHSDGGYFAKGDWHDTLRLPVEWGTDPIVLRSHADRFTGVVPVHCHNLLHEELGMLGVLQISGNEGATACPAPPSALLSVPVTSHSALAAIVLLGAWPLVAAIKRAVRPTGSPVRLF